ncbi:hypothetical protein [Variovorax gossypii]
MLLMKKRNWAPTPMVVAFVLLSTFVGSWLVLNYAEKEKIRRERDAGLAVTAMKAQAKELFVAGFPKMTYKRSAPYGGPMSPATVFEGATSTVLHVGGTLSRLDHPSFAAKLHAQIIGESMADRLFTASTISVPALARTSRGRYFLTGYAFTFEFPLDCVPTTKCGRLTDPEEISVEDAKAWVFREPSATPEDYERVFGEAMPPRQVPA